MSTNIKLPRGWVRVLDPMDDMKVEPWVSTQCPTCLSPILCTVDYDTTTLGYLGDDPMRNPNRISVAKLCNSCGCEFNTVFCPNSRQVRMTITNKGDP